MTETKNPTTHAVAIYSNHSQAEAAIKILKDAGHDIRQLSIIGQDYSTEEQPIGFINAGNRMMTWGKFGAFWGSIWGMLFGSAMIFLPGIGPLIFAGWIVSALEGAILGGGFAALGGALASIGIPQDSVMEYETSLRAGNFMLLIHGEQAEVIEAKAQLATSGPIQIHSYSTDKNTSAPPLVISEPPFAIQ